MRRAGVVLEAESRECQARLGQERNPENLGTIYEGVQISSREYCKDIY